jgi:hypothetical protein
VELSIGLALAAILVVVAVFFGLRQRHTFTQLRQDAQMSAEDRLYYIKQIRRRLICSVLMIVFAGLLVGWFFLDKGALTVAEGEPLTEEAKESLRFITWYWIIALFVLLAILFLASFDFLATARFGLRRVRQLENDRRAVLEMEAAKLRRRRQEMN